MKRTLLLLFTVTIIAIYTKEKKDTINSISEPKQEQLYNLG